MTDLDLLHFEQLKSEIQAQYLKSHHPSDDDISNWKGIDIIYFQEDLRKVTKGNISEKSFYTYFKTSPVTKLPRIDILNLLSIYAGYVSWYDFKKNHLFADEILEDLDQITENDKEILETTLSETLSQEKETKTEVSQKNNGEENTVLQERANDNEHVIDKSTKEEGTLIYPPSKTKKGFTNQIWYWVSGILVLGIGYLGFSEYFMEQKFTFTFIDADRNSKINDDLSVQILKKGESPIMFKVKPNEPFVYMNPESEIMTMVVSSPYYKTDTIIRNLKNAAEIENIELKPNDYAIMLYYYSKLSVDELKQKRDNLNNLISHDAIIYQVYDNDKYGIETMDKLRYINLMTTPTTSLKNLEVIDTQMKNGKIVLIKFRIDSDENIP